MSSKSFRVKKLQKGEAIEERTVEMNLGYEVENADRKSYRAVRMMIIPGSKTLKTNSVESSETEEVVTLCRSDEKSFSVSLQECDLPVAGAW